MCLLYGRLRSHQAALTALSILTPEDTCASYMDAFALTRRC